MSDVGDLLSELAEALFAQLEVLEVIGVANADVEELQEQHHLLEKSL